MDRIGTGTLCLVLAIGCVFCKMENIHVSFNDTARNLHNVGKLNRACIEKYYNLFVSRDVPKRRYRYHHEYQDLAENRRRYENKLQWRIIGGQQVNITEAPYTVLYGPYCGGCLISPDWVLTAAHCKAEDNFVVAGSTKISEGKHYHICAHFMHPGWDDPAKPHFHDYDFQLLLLESSVPVTPQSMPIAIGAPRDIVSGALVAVTGWGHTRSKQKSIENVLRKVSVPILPHSECRALPNKYYAQITPRMFCAGYFNGTKDSCQGDSGGPAVLNNKLVGIVSFGVGCAEKEKPGVYSNVPVVRSWIREVTGLPL